jgi:hypothetical protein
MCATGRLVTGKENTMNIRDHIRSAIHDGLPAAFAQQKGEAGVTFHDENEFIPFADLNYNNEYGYYRLSQFPDLSRDCTNENPETLHYGKDFGDDWKPIIWADSGGNLNMIGDVWQAADLYQALGRMLLHGEMDSEEISENDASWDYMKRIDWAVKEYRDVIGDNRDDDQIANTIRAAAKRGSVRGCSQDDTGSWYFRPPAFRGWLIKSRDEKRGRPRVNTPGPHFDGKVYLSDSDDPTKAISDLIENFDGDVSRLQHSLAAMSREATGNIPRGQLWQPCEHPGCNNEPVCMNCMMCEEKHCNCHR